MSTDSPPCAPSAAAPGESSNSRAGVGFSLLMFSGVGAWALLAISSAHAAVSVACSVSATGIAFGVYNPLNERAAQSTGTWTVICTATGAGSATVMETLTLSTGSSGSFFPRQMTAGSDRLAYNIYTGSAGLQIMGDSSGGTSVLSQAATVSSGHPHIMSGTLYGNLPPLQDVAPGTYRDELILTVTY